MESELVKDTGDDSFNVQLDSPIRFDTGYIALEDPETASSDLVKKAVEALKVRIRIRPASFEENVTPYLSGSFTQWREEFLEQLLKGMHGFSHQKKELAIRNFSEFIDDQIFQNFQSGLLDVYQQYTMSERKRYRIPSNDDYEIVMEEQEDKGFSGLERETLDECAELLLRADTILDLLSRSIVYGVFNEEKIITCDASKKKIMEKWNVMGDERAFKSILDLARRYINEISETRLLSCLRIKSDIGDPLPGLAVISNILGSEVFMILAGRHNLKRSVEQNNETLTQLEKLNKELEHYISTIVRLIKKFLKCDAFYELEKRAGVKKDLIKLFAGVFNGQELGVEDLSEFERIIDDQPITKAQLTRNAPEEESKSERDFRIDCVDFSRSQYLITK